jgi:transposase
VTALVKLIHGEQEKLPAHARSALRMIGGQLRSLASEIDRLETQIVA